MCQDPARLWLKIWCTALMRSKRRNDIASTLKGLEQPDVADSNPGRCAKEGPNDSLNGGLKASNILRPEAPTVCVRQRPEAGGRERKKRGLGNKKRRGLGAEGMTTKHEGCKVKYILRLAPPPHPPFLSLLLTLQPSQALTPVRLDPSSPYQ